MKEGFSVSHDWIINRGSTASDIEEELIRLYGEHAHLALRWMKNGCKAVDKPEGSS